VSVLDQLTCANIRVTYYNDKVYPGRRTMVRSAIFAATALAAITTVPAFAQLAPSGDPSTGPAQNNSGSAAGNPGAPAAASSAAGGDEIVVTARRVSENIQDVPLAVTAIGGSALQRQAIRNVTDLSSMVPNLQVKQGNTGGSGVAFTMRGQSQSNVGLLYIDPAVGAYVDGLAVPRNYGLRSGLVDVQRVEVLRGPQGTLYGRNTTGGAVSIITQDPKDEFGGSIRGTYGNYNTWDVLGILNVPLSEGIGLRLLAQHGEHDAYGRSLTSGVGLNDENSTYLRAKLKIDRGRLKASLMADYFNYKSNNVYFHLVGLTPANVTETRFSGRVCIPNTAAALAGGTGPRGAACTPAGGGAGTGIFYGVAGGATTNVVRQHLGLGLTAANLDTASRNLAQYIIRYADPPGGDFYDTFGNSSGNYTGLNVPDNLTRTRGASAVVNLDYELTDELTARSISGWRYYKRDDAYDIDATPYPLFGSDSLTPFDNFYSEEAQLIGNYGALSFVAGLYYSYERGLDFSASMNLQPPGASNWGRADGLSVNTSKAVFAQANYKITDQLTLTLGARYTNEVKKIRNRNRSVSTAGVVSCSIPQSLLNDPTGPQAFLVDPVTGAVTGTLVNCGGNFRASFSEPTWLASLDYKITADVLVYGKVSRGFRGGGQQGRAATPTIPLSFVPFAPEFVTEFEGGLKSDLFDRMLRLNLAVFYDKYTDVQRSLTLPKPDGSGGYTVVTNAGKARLWGIEAEAALKVTPEFTVEGNLAYLNPKYLVFNDFLLGDRTSEPWPAPKWTYVIGGRYQGEISDGTTLDANLQWVWTGTRNLQPQGLARFYGDENTQKGYGLLNGTLGVRLEETGIEISAYGRNILAKKYYVAGISLESVGINTLIPSDPRTFGLQITKRFGSER
jgi:iron complex outermembrane receptor protein